MSGWESAGRKPGKRRCEVQGVRRWAIPATQAAAANCDCTVTAQLWPPLAIFLVFTRICWLLDSQLMNIPSSIQATGGTLIFLGLIFRLEYCKMLPWHLPVTSLVRLLLEGILGLAWPWWGHLQYLTYFWLLLESILPCLPHQLYYGIWAAPSYNLKCLPT